MRILHTSDWHLGLSTGPASRLPEQRKFLDWLLIDLRERQIDVLIVAGDVFDTMHPAAEAQALYYRFLARIEQTGVRDVVVVGGNHDSASGLDAPGELLKTLGVHVVGGLPVADQRASKMLAPLRVRGSDELAAVCLMVPYVHEYRLGIRTTDLDLAATRTAFRDAFASLYKDLADAAQATYGDNIPLLATGHLTLGTGHSNDDYPREINRVGTIEGLPLDILDPRICYTALGHIHRCLPIKGSSGWYSGSPIAYSITEMSALRRVLVAEIGDEVSVKQIEVPRLRELIRLTGTPAEVIEQLSTLTWTHPLPPLVHVLVHTPMVEPGLVGRLHQANAQHAEAARPVLVEVHQRAPEVDRVRADGAKPPLQSLNPDDVFEMLCDAKGLDGAPRAQLLSAFATVQAVGPEDLAQMLADISVPDVMSEEAP